MKTKKVKPLYFTVDGTYCTWTRKKGVQIDSEDMSKKLNELLTMHPVQEGERPLTMSCPALNLSGVPTSKAFRKAWADWQQEMYDAAREYVQETLKASA